MIDFVGFARRVHSHEHGGAPESPVFQLCDGHDPEHEIYAVFMVGEDRAKFGLDPVGLILVGSKSDDDWYIHTTKRAYGGPGMYYGVPVHDFNDYTNAIKSVFHDNYIRPESYDPSIPIRHTCMSILSDLVADA